MVGRRYPRNRRSESRNRRSARAATTDRKMVQHPLYGEIPRSGRPSQAEMAKAMSGGGTILSTRHPFLGVRSEAMSGNRSIAPLTMFRSTLVGARRHRVPRANGSRRSQRSDLGSPKGGGALAGLARAPAVGGGCAGAGRPRREGPPVPCGLSGARRPPARGTGTACQGLFGAGRNERRTVKWEIIE